MATNPSGRFAKGQNVGRLVKGADADLVVLAGDPAQDIEQLAKVRYTLRGGRIIFKAE
jgi:imidazolonepropionase-like amidohydrolase